MAKVDKVINCRENIADQNVERVEKEVAKVVWFEGLESRFKVYTGLKFFHFRKEQHALGSEEMIRHDMIG